MKKDADEVRREKKRAHDKARRERRRLSRINGPYRQAIGGNTREVVDAAPLLEFIEGRIEKEVPRSGTARRGWEEIGRKTGIDQRTLRRIRLTGRAHIGTVDKLLIRLNGPPLSLLYPYED